MIRLRFLKILATLICWFTWDAVDGQKYAYTCYNCKGDQCSKYSEDMETCGAFINCCSREDDGEEWHFCDCNYHVDNRPFLTGNACTRHLCNEPKNMNSYYLGPRITGRTTINCDNKCTCGGNAAVVSWTLAVVLLGPVRMLVRM